MKNTLTKHKSYKINMIPRIINQEIILRTMKCLILTFCWSTTYGATQSFDVSPVSYTDPSQVGTTTVTNTDSIMPYQFIEYLKNLSQEEFVWLLDQLTNPYCDVYATIQYHLKHLSENQTQNDTELNARIEMLNHYLLLGDITITLDQFQTTKTTVNRYPHRWPTENTQPRLTTTTGEGTYTNNSFLQILYPDSLSLPPLTKETFDQLMSMQQDTVRRNTFAPLLLFSLWSLIDFLEEQLATTKEQLTILPINSLTEIRQKIKHLKAIYQSVQQARDTTKHTQTSLSLEQLFYRLGLLYKTGTASKGIQISMSQPRHLRPSLELFYFESNEFFRWSFPYQQEMNPYTTQFFWFTYTLRLPQANWSEVIYTLISWDNTPEITAQIAGRPTCRSSTLPDLLQDIYSYSNAEQEENIGTYTLPPDILYRMDNNQLSELFAPDLSEARKNDILATLMRRKSLDMNCLHPSSVQTIIDILTWTNTSIPFPTTIKDNITAVSVNNCFLQDIPAWLQLFPNLRTLNLSNNKLSGNALQNIGNLPIEQLILNNNPIGSINFALPNALVELSVSNTRLTSLPSPLPQFLEGLDCSNNAIWVIPPLPRRLVRLNISGNNLYSINSDIQSSRLDYIDISDNPLYTIPVLSWLPSWWNNKTMRAIWTWLSHSDILKLPHWRRLVLEENDNDTRRHDNTDYRYLTALQNQYPESMSVPYYNELSDQKNPALMLLNALPAATMSFDTKFLLGNEIPDIHNSIPQSAPLLSEVSPPLPGYYRQTVHTFSPTGTLDMAAVSGKYEIIDMPAPWDKILYTAILTPWTGWYIPLPLWAKIIDSGWIRVKRNNHTGIYATEPLDVVWQQVEISFVINRSTQEKTPRAPRFKQQINILPQMFSVNTDKISEEYVIVALMAHLQGQYYGFDSWLDDELDPFKSNAITYLNELYDRSMERYDNSLLTICNQNAAIAVARLNKHGIPARVIWGIYSSWSEVGWLGHAWVEYRSTPEQQWITIDPTSTKTPPDGWPQTCTNKQQRWLEQEQPKGMKYTKSLAIVPHIQTIISLLHLCDSPHEYKQRLKHRCLPEHLI